MIAVAPSDMTMLLNAYGRKLTPVARWLPSNSIRYDVRVGLKMITGGMAKLSRGGLMEVRTIQTTGNRAQKLRIKKTKYCGIFAILFLITLDSLVEFGHEAEAHECYQ